MFLTFYLFKQSIDALRFASRPKIIADDAYNI